MRWTFLIDVLEMRNWISLKYVNDLLDSTHNSNNVIHELVAVNSLNFELSATLHTFFMIALLAAKAIVVSTGYDRNRVVELVAEGTLDLWNDAEVELL